MEKLFYFLFPPVLSAPSTIFCKFLLHRPDNLLHPTYMSSSHSLSRFLQKSSDLHYYQLVVAWYKCRLLRLEEIACVVFYGGSHAFPPLQPRVVEPGDLGTKIGWQFFTLCLSSSNSNAWRRMYPVSCCISLMGSGICTF